MIEVVIGAVAVLAYTGAVAVAAYNLGAAHAYTDVVRQMRSERCEAGMWEDAD